MLLSFRTSTRAVWQTGERSFLTIKEYGVVNLICSVAVPDGSMQ